MDGNYVFADFELMGQRFELRRSGKRVTIQPKELRLLLYLVAHRGRAVSKAELLQALWPSETVCGGSIKRAVRGVRRALGDDGAKQGPIRTVRGYGYEFVQAVTPASCTREPRSYDVPRYGVCNAVTPALLEPAARSA